MKAPGRRKLLFVCAIALTVMLVGCSSGPPQAKLGTPQFHWNAAIQTHGAGDYAKVNDNLAEVIKTDNEFTARALPWRLVVLSGLTKGYADLADVWEAGSNANRANPTPFRTQQNAYRRLGGQLALQFGESLQKFQATNKGQKVTLAFAFPSGSAAEIAPLKRVSSGYVIPEAEVETLQRRVLEREVLLATCRAVGAPEDSAKAQQLFKAGPVEVEWPVFSAALANAAYELSQMFTRDHLDRPDRLEFFAKQALELLKGVPDSKETKSLRAKIEKALKKQR